MSLTEAFALGEAIIPIATADLAAVAVSGFPPGRQVRPFGEVGADDAVAGGFLEDPGLGFFAGPDHRLVSLGSFAGFRCSADLPASLASSSRPSMPGTLPRLAWRSWEVVSSLRVMSEPLLF